MTDQSFGIIPYRKKDNQILFLLIQHQKGHWAFPKGHKEGNETDLETALRELFEETGCKVKQVDFTHPFYEHYEFTQPDGTFMAKTVTFFPAEVLSETVKIQLAEVQAFAWLNYEEAKHRMTFPAGKKILDEVWNFLCQTPV